MNSRNNPHVPFFRLIGQLESLTCFALVLDTKDLQKIIDCISPHVKGHKTSTASELPTLSLLDDLRKIVKTEKFSGKMKIKSKVRKLVSSAKDSTRRFWKRSDDKVRAEALFFYLFGQAESVITFKSYITKGQLLKVLDGSKITDTPTYNDLVSKISKNAQCFGRFLLLESSLYKLAAKSLISPDKRRGEAAKLLSNLHQVTYGSTDYLFPTHLIPSYSASSGGGCLAGIILFLLMLAILGGMFLFLLDVIHRALY